jgi:hypothetical protein
MWAGQHSASATAATRKSHFPKIGPPTFLPQLPHQKMPLTYCGYNQLSHLICIVLPTTLHLILLDYLLPAMDTSQLGPIGPKNLSFRGQKTV